MRKIAVILLAVCILLISGCADRPDALPESSTIPEITEVPLHTIETESVTEAVPTDAIEETVDATSGATPTIPEGICKECGQGGGDYDGYCYYCHPDFLFTCANCGFEQPYHRTESGLCYECEALYAATGATPTESGKCRTCGAPEDDYDGYCYYCHPDFLFTCANCGFEQPYHRTESGLCYECEALDAATGATPYGS